MYKKVLFFIFVIFFALRLTGLGSDCSNSDSIRWYERSANFSNALKQFNFAETYQHYQPGVTLMWANSFVKELSGFYLKTFYPQKVAIYTLENTDWFVFYNKISVGF